MRVGASSARAARSRPPLVRDLAESDEVDGARRCSTSTARAARAVAEAHGAGKATAAAVDAADPQALALALEGCGLLVNAASYRVNLRAMDAASPPAARYVDLGGLYHVTAAAARARPPSSQRARPARGARRRRRARARRTSWRLRAARGARHASTRCAARRPGSTPTRRRACAAPTRSQTLLDELTVPPVVVRGGSAERARADDRRRRRSRSPTRSASAPSLYTLHSEVLTLPGSLGAARAPTSASSLGPGVLDAPRALRDRPRRRSSRRCARRRPRPRTYSAQHVEVTASADGCRADGHRDRADRAARGAGAWAAASSRRRSVAAATVRLLAARRASPRAGALPPERCLTAEDLFAELERARLHASRSRHATDERGLPHEGRRSHRDQGRRVPRRADAGGRARARRRRPRGLRPDAARARGRRSPTTRYAAQGARIVPDADAVFAEAELIVKVKEPQPEEVAPASSPRHTLFTYLHLAPDPELTQGAGWTSGATCIAYETVEDARRPPAAARADVARSPARSPRRPARSCSRSRSAAAASCSAACRAWPRPTCS